MGDRSEERCGGPRADRDIRPGRLGHGTRAAAIVGSECRRESGDGTRCRDHHVRRASGSETLHDQGARHERERRQHRPHHGRRGRSTEADGLAAALVAWRLHGRLANRLGRRWPLGRGFVRLRYRSRPIAGRNRRDGRAGHRGRRHRDVPGRDRRPLAVVPRIARHARCRDVRDHHRHPVRHAVPAAAAACVARGGRRYRHRDRGRGRRFGCSARRYPRLVDRERDPVPWRAPSGRGDRRRGRAAQTRPRGTRARGPRRSRRPAGRCPAEPRCGRFGCRGRRRDPGTPCHRGRPVAGRPRRPAPDDRADRGRAHCPGRPAVLVAGHDRDRGRRRDRPATGDRRGRDRRRARDVRFRSPRDRQDRPARPRSLCWVRSIISGMSQLRAGRSVDFAESARSSCSSGRRSSS